MSATSPWVNVKDYGATGNGATDDASVIQSAFNTGGPVMFPPGNYLVSKALTPSVAKQRIAGSAREQTIITGANGFSGLGVLAFNPALGEGPQIEDLSITVQTPGNGTLIYAQNTTRFNLNRLRLHLGAISVDMRNNCGGSNLNDVETWATNTDVWIDGSEDTININGLRAFNWGDPTGQYINHTWINSGRCDGLFITNSMAICVNQLVLFNGTQYSGGGSTFGGVTNSDFDTYNGIIMQAGEFNVSNCILTGGVLSGHTVAANIAQSGGLLNVTGCYFGNANSSMVVQTGGTLNLTGNNFQGAGNANAFVLEQGPSAILNAHGNTFSRAPGVGGTAMINVLSGRATLIGNRCPIDGSGNFIHVASDEWHRVVYNVAGGWTNSFPPNGWGIYSPN